MYSCAVMSSLRLNRSFSGSCQIWTVHPICSTFVYENVDYNISGWGTIEVRITHWSGGRIWRMYMHRTNGHKSQEDVKTQASYVVRHDLFSKPVYIAPRCVMFLSIHHLPLSQVLKVFCDFCPFLCFSSVLLMWKLKIHMENRWMEMHIQAVSKMDF